MAAAMDTVDSKAYRKAMRDDELVEVALHDGTEYFGYRIVGVGKNAIALRVGEDGDIVVVDTDDINWWEVVGW